MTNQMVQVPVSLLQDPGPTAATKLVWMARRLAPTATPAELERLTGLSRPTLLAGLGQIVPSYGGPRVKIPAALLADASVRPQAKVLYGLLQAGCRGGAGQFTYASLRTQTGLDRGTLRRATAQLAGAGWIQLSQATRLRPIKVRLGSPALRRSQLEAIVAERRMKRANHRGESLMQEYLSLLIDSDQYTDNARPGFLVSPLTGERLELDRYYPPDLAFEFNGAQHYQATERVSQAGVAAQHLRDLIKAGICLYRGIQLVIIHPEDLSLQGMITRIGQSAPLRDLAGHEPLIELLEAKSLCYLAAERNEQKRRA